MNFVNKNLSTRGRQSHILTVGGVLAALLLTPALLRSKPPDTVHRTAYFGPLGLTTTSSARLNVIAREAVEIELLFLDSEGNIVADSGPVSLAPGEATHLTLAGASLAYAPGALRAQVQARVELLSTPGHSLAFASLELLDADDTVLVLYPQNPIRAVDNKEILNARPAGPPRHPRAWHHCGEPRERWHSQGNALFHQRRYYALKTGASHHRARAHRHSIYERLGVQRRVHRHGEF